MNLSGAAAHANAEVGSLFAARDDAAHARSGSHITLSDGGRGDGLERLEAFEEHHKKHIHPSAKRLYKVAPFLKYIPIFSILIEAHGVLPIIGLAYVYAFTKGLASYLLQNGANALYMDNFNGSDSDLQRLSACFFLAFSIKSFFATLSDTFAFFGYKKRWMLTMCTVMGAVLALVPGVLPGKPSSVNPATACLFLSSFFMAGMDVLSEGHYSRMMQRHAASGPQLLSWVWVFQLLLIAVSVVITGTLDDAHKARVPFYIAAVAMLLPIPVLAFNWYGEKTNREDRLEDAKRLMAVEMRRKEMEAAAKALAADNGDGVDASVNVIAQPKNLHPERDSERQREPADGDDPNLVGVTVTDGEAASGKELVSGDGQVGAHNGEHMHDLFLPPVSLCNGIIEVNKEVVFRNWRLYAYSYLMLALAMVLFGVLIGASPFVVLGVSIGAGAVLAVVGFFVFLLLPLWPARTCLSKCVHTFNSLSRSVPFTWQPMRACRVVRTLATSRSTRLVKSLAMWLALLAPFWSRFSSRRGATVLLLFASPAWNVLRASLT